jgi:hypothetical protein
MFSPVTAFSHAPSPLPAALDCRGHRPAFVVKDSTGQKLAYVYYEDEPGRRSAAKLLSKDEARRIASNIAKLPVRVAEAHNQISGIASSAPTILVLSWM